MTGALRRSAAVSAGLRMQRRETGLWSPLRLGSLVAALIPSLALAFVVVTLLVEAWPAVLYNGLGFLTRVTWNAGNFYGSGVVTHGIAHPPGVSYGALPLVAGTVESALIAVLVGVPVSLGAAFAIVEFMPRVLAHTAGMFLELLAGIPSVVIGLWGALTLGPFLAHDVAPLFASGAARVPGLGFARGNVGNGEGLLTSGLILALMITPIVAATARDLLAQVPVLPKEGGLALGMSDWEVARSVTVPWVASGLVGAVVLGLGRALGETMAVAMVSGVVLGAVPQNLYATMTTISATIVSQLDSALTDSTGFAVRTLAEAGLLLLLITLGVNLVARLLVRRVASAALPIGRGI